jgi:hypothetical protein
MNEEEVTWAIRLLRDSGCKVIESRRLPDGSVTIRIDRQTRDVPSVVSSKK